jgi:O-succinylbenzoic acid--CoA ligase
MITVNKTAHWLKQQSVSRPNAIAFNCDANKFTYKNFYEECLAAAQFLSGRGINENDNIGLLFEHNHKFFIAVNALWFIGAVPVLLNTKDTNDEILKQAKQADVKIIVASKNYEAKYIFDQSGIILILPEDKIYRQNNLDFSSSALADFNINKNALILFTSGSSGKPKAAVHTFNSLFASVNATDHFSGLSESDVWLSSLPHFHIGGFMILLRGLLTGSQIIYPTSLAYEDIKKSIVEFQPSHISFVTTTLLKLLEENFIPSKKTKQVYLGGGPLNPDICLEAFKKGWPLVKSYGSTETCSMAAAMRPEEIQFKPDSAGKAIGQNQIAILKKDDNAISNLPDNAGEIIIRCDSMFKEYYNDGETTSKKIIDGFYYTGDLGWIDDEGYLFVLSRREDIIITGGENVSAAEVEQILLDIDSVSDVFVFGLPDKKWGQKLCAALVAKNLSAEELKIILKQKTAPFKIPKELYFIDEIPRTELGKVNRPLLLKLLKLD